MEKGPFPFLSGQVVIIITGGLPKRFQKRGKKELTWKWNNREESPFKRLFPRLGNGNAHMVKKSEQIVWHPPSKHFFLARNVLHDHLMGVGKREFLLFASGGPSPYLVGCVTNPRSCTYIRRKKGFFPPVLIVTTLQAEKDLKSLLLPSQGNFLA